MSSFARGLELGSRAGERFVDSYNKAQRAGQENERFKREKEAWEKQDALERDISAVPATGDTRFTVGQQSSISPELAEGLGRAYKAGGQEQVNNVLGAYAQAYPDQNYSVMGLQKKQVTDTDYAKGLAGVYAKHGKPGEAIAMRNQARTSERDTYNDLVMNMVRADLAGDDAAFMKYAGQALTVHDSSLYPIDMNVNPQTGSIDVNMWDAKAKRPVPFSGTRKDIIGRALAAASPEAYMQHQQFGLLQSKDKREQQESQFKYGEGGYYSQQLDIARKELEGQNELRRAQAHYYRSGGHGGAGAFTREQRQQAEQIGEQIASIQRGMSNPNLTPAQKRVMAAELRAATTQYNAVLGRTLGQDKQNAGLTLDEVKWIQEQVGEQKEGETPMQYAARRNQAIQTLQQMKGGQVGGTFEDEYGNLDGVFGAPSPAPAKKQSYLGRALQDLSGAQAPGMPFLGSEYQFDSSAIPNLNPWKK